jgi:NCS1 family nucleobase:cation symporter-1
MQSVELGAVADRDQTQRPTDLFLIFAGANIVATTLQIGGWVTGFSYSTAMLVIAAGAIAGAGLVAALAPVGSRLRVPSIVAARAALGFQGAQLVALFLFVTNFFWIADNNVIAASIVARLVHGASGAHEGAWAVLIGLIATVTVLGGPRAVGLADRVAVPTLFVSGVVMTIACFRIPWPASDAPPATALSVLRGFDMPFGYQTTWLLMFADYSRYSRSPRGSAVAVLGGLGITALWFMPLGMIAAAAAQSTDPGAMVFGLQLGWWGGILLMLGTLTTNFVNIYMSALALKSLRPTVSNATAIWIIGGIGAAISVLGKFWFDQFVDMIGLLAGVLVPIGGLLVAHYLVLKRQPRAADLYHGANGAPPAVGAWSTAGMAAWIVGAAVFYLARPIGGTLPSLATSIVTYLSLARRSRANSQ